MRTKETEYMYATARIRALEGSLIGRDRLYAMAESKSIDELYSMLAESGVTMVNEPVTDGEEVRVDIDATITHRTDELYALVRSIIPDPSLFDYLRYPYDCNNLKAAIKCGIRGVDPDDMLFEGGCVPASEAVRAVRDGDFRAFPAHMAQAAQDASEAYAKSGDPRKIDLILDRACYLDMEAAASCDDFLSSLLSEKIDLTNILTCIRLMRSDSGMLAVKLMDEAFIPGGRLSEGFFRDAMDGGEGKLSDMLTYSAYSALTSSVDIKTSTLGEIECAADNLYMDSVCRAKMIPFGPAVVMGFLTAIEYETKNIRIIAAGRLASLAPDVIRRRIRRSYV